MNKRAETAERSAVCRGWLTGTDEAGRKGAWEDGRDKAECPDS